MKCYKHPNIDAKKKCVKCGRGLCKSCKNAHIIRACNHCITNYKGICYNKKTFFLSLFRGLIPGLIIYSIFSYGNSSLKFTESVFLFLFTLTVPVGISFANAILYKICNRTSKFVSIMIGMYAGFPATIYYIYKYFIEDKINKTQ